MDFLEKLNYLMEKNNLNKSTLSKACNIPYTTIDGWYKKGYEGLKLTTLRKLADYFGTTLDFWATDEEKIVKPIKNQKFSEKEKEFFTIFDELSPALQEYLIKTAKDLLETQSKLQSQNHKKP